MPLDPSIALSVKPFNLDIGDVYNKLAAQRQVEQAQQLNALKLQEAQQGVQSRNALRQLDPTSPDYINRVSMIDPALGMQMRKEHAATQASEAQTAERRANTAKTQDAIVAQGFRDISSNPSDENILSVVAKLKNSGVFSSQQLAGLTANAQALLQVPMDQRGAILGRFGATAGEITQATKPHYVNQTSGTVERVLAIPPSGGAATVVPGSELAVTMTPGEAARLTVSQGQLGVAQGNLQVAKDRLSWEKEHPGYEIKDTDTGMVAINKRNPEDVKPITFGPSGAQVQSSKGLTDTQAKATGFAMRAEEADKIITATKGSPTAVALKHGLESTYGIGGALGVGANAIISSESQSLDQAQRNFVNAVLRQESGAAISQSEFDNARRQYFPQPNDDKKVIEQKANNRKTAIQSLKTIAGPGVKKMEATKAKTSETELLPIDKQALDWANANPADPRAAMIKQRLGVQ